MKRDKAINRRMAQLGDLIPVDIPLVEHSQLGMGFDVATTENEHSNPSAVALVEKIGGTYMERFLIRWKSNSPDVARAIIRTLLMRIAPRRVRRLCIDASNEKYFAVDMRSDMASLVPIDLVVSSENITYMGEEMIYKTYLGNLLINHLDDGLLALADEDWVQDDFRLVKRDRGTFYAETDSSGNHADTFDATKLALHSLISAGGPATAEAVRVGNFDGARGDTGRVFLNQYARYHQPKERTLC